MDFVGNWMDFVGNWVVELILKFARWVTGEGTPGLLSLGLVAALVLFSLWYCISAWRFHRALGYCRSILRQVDGRITGENVIEIDKHFESALKRRTEPRHRLGVAWEEFRETTVTLGDKTNQLHNTVRPTAFFGREELGLNHGIWRYIPALFVSVGLFLTFLGLVAALDQTSEILREAESADNATTEGLTTLLRIAGAKFIMSLTGLLCSIIFTLVLRFVAKRTDGILHKLCADIEKRCTFLSEQMLLSNIINHAKEQTENLKIFSTELVAQIAKPLREELPETIRSSIAQAMAPAIETLSRSTGKGIEMMADNVSSQLVHGIQDSVNAMNEAIGNVSNSLEFVTKRLDQSANKVGGQVDSAVEALTRQIGNLETAMAGSSKEAARTFNEASDAMLREMNEALQKIQTTSTDGAQQIADANRAMAETAKTLSHNVQGSVMTSVESSGRQIERAGQEMASSISTATGTMRENLLGPMSAVAEKVASFVSTIEAASDRMKRFADSVGTSAATVTSSNEGLERSAQTLENAAAPVRDAIIGIESTSKSVADRVEAASASMQLTTKHTESLMRGAREAIEASQSTMREAIVSLQDSIREFKNVLERYDKIDRNLGDAFRKIETAVQSSINEIGNFERNLNKEFGDALNRLQAVIAQAEPFKPRPKE